MPVANPKLINNNAILFLVVIKLIQCLGVKLVFLGGLINPLTQNKDTSELSY